MIEHRNMQANIKRPYFCSIVLSTKCSFKCKMCEMWKSDDDSNQVSTGQWKEFIGSLAHILDGPRELVFSGGEPLLRKDVFDLIKFGTEKGFKTLMPTNGYLIDEDIAKRITDSGLKEIYISLDSIDDKTHDFLRGVNGSFKRANRAFDNLQRYCPELKVGIITVISEVNYNEVSKLVKWVKKAGFLNGVYYQVIAKPFFVSLDNNWYKEDKYGFLWPKDIIKIHSVLDELIRLKKDGYPIHNFPLQLEIFKAYFENPIQRARKSKCYLGDYVINLNPSGDISLCCFMEPIGNIKNDDINRLWYSEKASLTRTQMYNCNINCNNVVNCFFQEEKNLTTE